MTLDLSTYVRTPSEKAGDFAVRILRSAGIFDAADAVPRASFKAINVPPVTFMHLIKQGQVAETTVEGEIAFYALAVDADATSSDPTSSNEATMTETAPVETAETSTETAETSAAAETPAVAPAATEATASVAAPAKVKSSRPALVATAPAVCVLDAEPDLTLRGEVLRTVFEGERPLAVAEIVFLTGCQRQSVAVAVGEQFKAGFLVRDENEDPFHYAINPEKTAEILEIISERGAASKVWRALLAADTSASIEKLTELTGLTYSQAAGGVKSLVKHGWASAVGKEGRTKFYAAFATKQAPVADEEPETVEAVAADPAAAAGPVIAEPVIEIEEAPAPAPVAAAPLSIFEQLLQTDDGIAALRASFDANALLIAAITKVAKKG